VIESHPYLVGTGQICVCGGDVHSDSGYDTDLGPMLVD
jgi:hypothetical protein